MPYEFKTERRVEFVDTDMAGIMHFSNFFRFMESTEHAFFRSLGEPLHTNADGRMRGWARVHAECDYSAPLRYQDVVEVHLLVREKRPSALSYVFVFRTQDREVARGALTVVCVAHEEGEERMRPVPMPAAISERVEVAPAELISP
ncbi:MAG: acyl-CoA thioesterase [bacterium]|nr:acyl-CoA thioesterase [bacterium]